MEAYADRLDVDKIREAYELAVEAHADQQVENYRKMPPSMAEDARVILVGHGASGQGDRDPHLRVPR